MRNTKTYRPISAPMLALLALLFFDATTINAAPGDLDPTFGNGGIALANRGNNPTVLLYSASAMAIQPDGKIVVVGQGVGESHGASWESAVVRFNPDGSLDTSLGGTGIVINPVGDGFYSVAIQPDGKIVVVNSVTAGTFGVVRYNPNGSLDTSFNGSGIVVTPVDSNGGSPSSVAIQTDGKIVVAGSNGNDSFAIIRYNPNGSLDTSFNGSGIVLTPVGRASSVAIQADGKIIAAGGTGFSGSGFTLVRYNADGSLDTSFNGTGIVITPVGDAGSGASDLAIQTDGKIVAVGYGVDANAVFAVVRYNPEGSLDTSFGGTGKILIPNDDSGSDYASSVAIQPNGKIVVGGIRNSSLTSEFAVGRLNPNGSVDTSFNGTGIVTTSVGGSAGVYDEGGSVAIQADGKIVVAGDTGPDEFKSFVVVRYQGDGASPTSCPNPIDCADFFVSQHYRDFLNREPDPDGLAFWTNEITSCGADVQCIDVKRINVSAAFFLSIEFQNTGYLVERMYKAAYGDATESSTGLVVPILRRAELTTDSAILSQNVVVNSPGWEQTLEANKRAYSTAFVQRQRFIDAYPPNLSPDEFVARLNLNTGNVLTQDETNVLVAELSADPTAVGRANVLMNVAENSLFDSHEKNRAFVLMQYFGYLRRDPDSPPDSNYSGYQFWLAKLDQFGGDFVQAEMVKAFIQSTEYRQRFAQ